MKPKNVIPLSSAFAVLLSIVITAFSFNQNAFAHGGYGFGGRPFSIAIPADLQPLIAEDETGNGTVFNFQTHDGDKIFLFSVNKVTVQQWMQVKNTMQHATVIKFGNEYVWYAEKTSKTKIKGADDEQYQQIYGKLDAMIASIHINE